MPKITYCVCDCRDRQCECNGGDIPHGDYLGCTTCCSCGSGQPYRQCCGR